MNRRWPTVRLGEVLRHRKEFITIDDLATYKRPRVQLHAQGIVLRDEIPGALVKTKSQQLCRAGEFLVAEIDAKVGGYGMVPDSLHGAIVSSHYFLFEVDESRLDRRFLDYFSRTPTFSDQVKAQGSTNYAAIRPANVLSYKIPLPPLEEQRRIVGGIGQLATLAHRAKNLREQVDLEAATLISQAVDAALRPVGYSVPLVRLKEVAESITDGDHLPPPKSESGVPFLFISHVVGGAIDFSNCKHVPQEYFQQLAPSRVPRRGDVLYTVVGSYGVPCLVDTDTEFCFQRHIALIRPRPDRILPQYLVWALRSSSVFDQATSLATGSAQLTVPLRGVRALLIPLPNLAEQVRVVTALDRLKDTLDDARRSQADSALLLDTLLPSVLETALDGRLLVQARATSAKSDLAR